MDDVASQMTMVLAKGGMAGGRNLIMLALIIVIVLLALGWMAYAAKVRAERRNKQ